MKTVVKMFKEQFADKVASGTKRQTVRPWPKRPRDLPHRGDKLDARKWSGKPYRSKQIKLLEGLIKRVVVVEISKFGRYLIVDGIALTKGGRDAFAKDDGFKDWEELVLWFKEAHGLPFEGIAIFWDVTKTIPRPEVTRSGGWKPTGA